MKSGVDKVIAAMMCKYCDDEIEYVFSYYLNTWLKILLAELRE